MSSIICSERKRIKRVIIAEQIENINSGVLLKHSDIEDALIVSSESTFLQDMLCNNDKTNKEEHDQENQAVCHGTWRKFEDDQLFQAIKELGTNKWMECPKYVPTRTAKQCRDRYINVLKPELKKTMFEEWEDMVIIQKHSILGNKWSRIASSLPGRSPNDVKNRWYSRLLNETRKKMSNK